MPFWRSRRHLVSGAKPQVCSVKAHKLGFWLRIKCGSWCHEFMLFSSQDFLLINEIKNVSLKINLPRDISLRPSRSNPYILSSEFDVKYLFTTQFLDYYFKGRNFCKDNLLQRKKLHNLRYVGNIKNFAKGKLFTYIA